MLQYVSTLGGGAPVDFETAILEGYAPDGGLYVPEHLPRVSSETLRQWADLSYPELVFEVLSLFIDRRIVSEAELRQLTQDSFESFTHEDIIPLRPLSPRGTYVMELFHGPTLSFKDVAMGFLVNLVDFFLQRKGQHRNILVATTGDTGPAAAHASVGKSTLDTWVLYPKGMVTEEQERQMTSLSEKNVHAVAVEHCPEGGDDLDFVISQLMDKPATKEKYGISSVNSINWGRVMVQTVHYFYSYFRVVDRVGERVSFSVPSGAFGNLCAGTLAREMGLPVEKFICATNENATLYRIFEEGVLNKKKLINTPSSAIDIILPYNFWRFLYFITGQDAAQLKAWTKQFKETGELRFDADTYNLIKRGIRSVFVTNADTLAEMKRVYEEQGYLADPHLAVALSAGRSLRDQLPPDGKLICLATAHPAKFKDVVLAALESDELPASAQHPSLEAAKERFHNLLLCEQPVLHRALLHALEQTRRPKEEVLT
ncbi:MAG: threonine synthase [Tunicatimonas sp.]